MQPYTERQRKEEKAELCEERLLEERTEESNE